MGRLKTRYVLLIGAYCAGIFYLSSVSEPPEVEVSLPFLDKWVHVVLYFGLAATVSVGIRRSNDKVAPWVQWGVPFVFAVLYGVTDEIHQSFVPNRSAELLDLAADALGAGLAQLVLLGVVWRGRRRG